MSFGESTCTFSHTWYVWPAPPSCQVSLTPTPLFLSVSFRFGPVAPSERSHWYSTVVGTASTWMTAVNLIVVGQAPVKWLGRATVSKPVTLPAPRTAAADTQGMTATVTIHHLIFMISLHD